MSSVSLRENDSLDGRNPCQLNNDELRFWLKCRGDNGKGLLTKVKRPAKNTEFI